VSTRDDNVLRHVDPLLMLSADAVERACRAHWPSWDRMRAEHQRKWRVKMEAALRAALTR